MEIYELARESPGQYLMWISMAEDCAECIINKVLGFSDGDWRNDDPYNCLYYHSADHYDDSVEFDFFLDNNSKGITLENFPYPNQEQVKEICQKCDCSKIYINFYDHEEGKKLKDVCYGWRK